MKFKNLVGRRQQSAKCQIHQHLKMVSEKDVKQPDKPGGCIAKTEKELQGKSGKQYQIRGLKK